MSGQVGSESTVAVGARFGRLEHPGLLLGLDAAQLALLALACGVAVVGVYGAGVMGLVTSAPVWGLLAAVGTVSVADRPVASWLPLVAHWRARCALRATSGLASTRRSHVDGDVLTLPGISGRLEVVTCEELGGVLVVDRRAGTTTGVARLQGTGFVLDDVAAQDHKVAAWGRVLASLCQQPAVVRVQLVLRTVPGGLSPVRRWWRERCVSGSPSAAGILADLLDSGFVTTHRTEQLLAVAVRTPRGHRRLTDDAVRQVAEQLAGIESSLRAAGLLAGEWLDRADLTAVLRSAYDPSDAAAEGSASSALLGPMGVEEHWSYLRTDSAVHATFWVSEWPRSEVHPAFLQPLLLGETQSRTLTVIAEPLPVRAALREIRRAKAEHAADAAQRTRIGQVEDEATRAEVDDLNRREAELVAGHGDLRFTGLISVSALDLAALDAACAATQSAAARSMCELRRLVGQQGLAHLAAAVPLARGVL